MVKKPYLKSRKSGIIFINKAPGGLEFKIKKIVKANKQKKKQRSTKYKNFPTGRLGQRQ